MRASIFCPAQPDSLFESGYLILVLLDCYEEGHYIIHTNVNLTVVCKQTLVHLRQVLYFWRTCHTNQALKLHFVQNKPLILTKNFADFNGRQSPSAVPKM